MPSSARSININTILYNISYDYTYLSCQQYLTNDVTTRPRKRFNVNTKSLFQYAETVFLYVCRFHIQQKSNI